MRNVDILACIGVFLLSQYVQITSASGKLLIQFTNFRNPSGRTSSGACCDGSLGHCSSACDTAFEICLGQTMTFSTCEYARIDSGEIRNSDTIVFGDKVGLLDNPLMIHLPTWPTTFALNIRVWDRDHHRPSHDHVADLHKKVYVFPNNVRQTLRLQRGVYLNLVISGQCDLGYYGDQCDVFCKSTEQSTFLCGAYGKKICKPGWNGIYCEININDCNSSVCVNGGQCIDQINDYSCQCAKGYRGKRCQMDIDECIEGEPSICNHGKCVNNNGGFDCQCDPGFIGPLCLLEVDPCGNEPCQNNGVCTKAGSLQDFVCSCTIGFTGRLCDEDINECDDIPCENNGTCQNQVGSFQCICSPGFQGQLCEQDIDECAASPTNPCGNVGVCTNLLGGFECNCPSGFNWTTTCENINECTDLVNPCNNHGLCIDLEGSFSCECTPYWTGSTCEHNIDECTSMPCLNQGICVDVEDGFNCNCDPQWKGSLCQEAVNSCVQGGNPCRNGTHCINVDGTFKCECLQGWIGPLCEEKVHCSRMCKNNASCVTVVSGELYCVCSHGWTGLNCDIPVVDEIGCQGHSNSSCKTHSSQIDHPNLADADNQEAITKQNLSENAFHIVCDSGTETDGPAFDDRLKLVLSELQEFKKESITVTHIVKQRTDHTRDSHNILFFPRVEVNGTVVTSHQLSAIFSDHQMDADSFQQMLCPNLVKEVLFLRGSLATQKNDVKDQEPWYPFLVLILVIGSIIVSGVLFFRYRSRLEMFQISPDPETHLIKCVKDLETTIEEKPQNETEKEMDGKLKGASANQQQEHCVTIEAEQRQSEE